MESQVREKYTDIGYKPILVYVVFGVTENEMQVSQEKHHVDGFPEDLQAMPLNRAEHGDYIDGFLGGDLGRILEEDDPELYARCKAAENCVIIRGEVKEDATFDYMRNVIGIMQAFIDQGAVGVLDLLTLSLYAPEKWTERFFEKEVNAQNHVMILCSEEEDGFWMHTRGMAEFGRPDCSVHHVRKEDLDEYKKLVDQIIYYGGGGEFFDGGFRLHTARGYSCSVQA